MASRITIGGEIKDAMMRDYVQALSTLGYKAMLYAYQRREFQHRTRNLHDSYGSAVYVNGELQEDSIRYIGGILRKKVDYTTHKTGRETLLDYLRSHKLGATTNEIVLVVVAAMFYAGILENKGGTRTRDRYIVISPAREYIDNNYQAVLSKYYQKWGIKEKPKARVIKGETLP